MVSLKTHTLLFCFSYKNWAIENFHLISLQRNACIFVKKSRVNFALAKYTYHLEIFKSFKTNCRLSYF